MPCASVLFRAAATLPAGVIDALLTFKSHGNRVGALLLRNMPIDPDLPPTPTDGRSSAEKQTMTSENALLTVMSVVGHVIAYAAEKEGVLVQEVTPVRGMEQRQENSGSVRFHLHTENAFHAFPPDYVGLVCLRPDPGGGARTMICPAAAAVSRLGARTIDTLRRPVYSLRPPSSFPSTAPVLHRAPIISGPATEPFLRVDFYNTVAPDSAGADALAELRDIMEDAALTVSMRLGDLLITDNMTAAQPSPAMRVQPVG
jgi:L-asparagine oxygenase